jgi:hypothetical protein
MSSYENELEEILETAQRDLTEVEQQLVRIREAKVAQIKSSARDKWMLVNMSRTVVQDTSVNPGIHQLTFDEAFAQLEQPQADQIPDTPKVQSIRRFPPASPGIAPRLTNGRSNGHA